MKIAITGGSGFIGSRLAVALAADFGHHVRIVDVKPPPLPSWTFNYGRLSFHQKSVLDRDTLLPALDGCEVVYHLASLAGVDNVIKNPLTTIDTILLGTRNVLEASADVGVSRVINVSTSEVFGRFAYRAQEGDVTSLGPVGEARWTYAVSKLAAEHMVTAFGRANKISTLNIRPFNVYGPGQVGEGAVHAFVRAAIANEDLVVHNDGSQIRAWTFVDDVVDALVKTIGGGTFGGEVVNVGNPRGTITIYGLAREVIRLAGSASKIRFEARVDVPDVEVRVPDVAKAWSMFGWEPRVELEEGILRTIEWYRSGS